EVKELASFFIFKIGHISPAFYGAWYNRYYYTKWGSIMYLKKRQTLMDEFVFPSLIIIMTKLKNVPARKQWRLLAESLMN
ncbi:MAG: hypothetical protein ACLUPF_08540, partial [Dorea sp.]